MTPSWHDITSCIKTHLHLVLLVLRFIVVLENPMIMKLHLECLSLNRITSHTKKYWVFPQRSILDSYMTWILRIRKQKRSLAPETNARVVEIKFSFGPGQLSCSSRVILAVKSLRALVDVFPRPLHSGIPLVSATIWNHICYRLTKARLKHLSSSSKPPSRL